jgi:mono/diheme cytochrome c family protein
LNEGGKKKNSKQHLVEDLDNIHQMGLFGEAPKGNGTNGENIFKTMCAQCHVVEKYGGHKQHDIKKGKEKGGLSIAANAFC